MRHLLCARLGLLLVMPAVWEAAAFHHTTLMTTLPRLRGVSATSAVRGSRSLEASASTAADRRASCATPPSDDGKLSRIAALRHIAATVVAPLLVDADPAFAQRPPPRPKVNLLANDAAD